MPLATNLFGHCFLIQARSSKVTVGSNMVSRYSATVPGQRSSDANDSGSVVSRSNHQPGAQRGERERDVRAGGGVRAAISPSVCISRVKPVGAIPNGSAIGVVERRFRGVPLGDSPQILDGEGGRQPPLPAVQLRLLEVQRRCQLAWTRHPSLHPSQSLVGCRRQRPSDIGAALFDGPADVL